METSNTYDYYDKYQKYLTKNEAPVGSGWASVVSKTAKAASTAKKTIDTGIKVAKKSMIVSIKSVMNVLKSDDIKKELIKINKETYNDVISILKGMIKVLEASTWNHKTQREFVKLFIRLTNLFNDFNTNVQKMPSKIVSEKMKEKVADVAKKMSDLATLADEIVPPSQWEKIKDSIKGETLKIKLTDNDDNDE